MTLLTFVDALQRQAVDQVAFYPKSALLRAIEADQIVTVLENGEPCGYLWHGPARGGRDLVVYQAVVHYDLRRRMRGAAMVAILMARATEAACRGVRLRCRASLEANEFWQAMGFQCAAVRPGGVRRGGEVNEWRYDLTPSLLALWVTPSTEPDDPSGYRPGGHGSRWDRKARARRVA